MAWSAQPSISYLLDLRNPPSHLVHVEMAVRSVQPHTEIQFPAWNNLYQIRDFARNIRDLEGECDGHPEILEHVDLSTWRTDAASCRQLTLHYSVLANEESPFSSVVNADHAFLNFALLLFYLPRRRGEEVSVRFRLPPAWKLATLLETGPVPDEFRAGNYDLLVDSPAEAGEFQEYSYAQSGATYRVIVHANPDDYSPKRLLESLQRITAEETALMREVPFSRYTFIFHFPRSRSGGGGMEHRFGTAITMQASDLRRNWKGLEATAAHEFFHLWNVKRIRPQALEPIDYVHGNDTRDLWFAEGLTSTYGELTMLRAGLITRRVFYDDLAAEIQQLQSRPARRWQSVEEAGLEAWFEKYPDYVQPERSISYYNKGALVGFLLDLAIRAATANRASLDDIMRALNQRFARRGRCFTRKDLRETIREFAPTFTRLDAFFADYVSGTRELDYAYYLGLAGLKLETSEAARPALGFRAARAYDNIIRVEEVEANSNAEQAGLKKGDALMKLNHEALDHVPDERGLRMGEKLEFQVRRGNQVMTIRFDVGARKETVYSVEDIQEATPDQRRVREGWLKGETATALATK
ncbi:MAG TPA: hypothetical protein VFD30_15385 [Terriglobia bacterium]|jgi:predicted metalloprotease with PDZ domain|nr:hypothetical protein [Terriglobia bacterium]